MEVRDILSKIIIAVEFVTCIHIIAGIWRHWNTI